MQLLDGQQVVKELVLMSIFQWNQDWLRFLFNCCSAFYKEGPSSPNQYWATLGSFGPHRRYFWTRLPRSNMCIAQNSCPNLLPSWSKLLGGGNRGQDVGCQLWSNWRRGRGDTQGKLPSACWQQPSQLLLAFVGWQQSSQAPQLNWKPHHGSWRGSNCQKENNTAHSLY